jgi:hypothetical protein
MSFYQNFKRKIAGKNGASTLEDLRSDGQFITLSVGDAIQKNSGETWVKIEGYSVDGVVMKYNNIFDRQSGGSRNDAENDSRYVQLTGNNVLSGAVTFNGNNTFNGTNKFTKPVTVSAEMYSATIDNSGYINTDSIDVANSSALRGWVKIGEQSAGEPDQTSNFIVYGTTELVRDVKTDLDLTVGRNLTVNGISTLNGQANLNHNLVVYGTTDLKSKATLERGLDVTGDTTLNGDLTVSGTITSNGEIILNNRTTFNGASNIKGALTVDGSSAFNDDVTILATKSLSVKNITNSPTIDNLFVSGTSSLTGAVTCGNTLTVTQSFTGKGDAYFEKNVTVYGNIANNDNSGDIGSKAARWANIYNINQNSTGTFTGNVINFASGSVSGTLKAKLFNGKATSAQHADLAEKYNTDETYDIGTVLQVNTSGETQGTIFNGGSLLGVVSGKPGLMINSDGKGQYVALKGMIPVKVAERVKKGQYCIATADGKVKGVDKIDLTQSNMLDLVGVALEDSKFNTELKFDTVLVKV